MHLDVLIATGSDESCLLKSVDAFHFFGDECLLLVEAFDQGSSCKCLVGGNVQLAAQLTFETPHISLTQSPLKLRPN